MKIELNTYRHNSDAIKRWVDVNQDISFSEKMNRLCIFTGCPLIVVAHLYGELYGFNSELNGFIKRLTEFYGYTEVS